MIVDGDVKDVVGSIHRRGYVCEDLTGEGHAPESFGDSGDVEAHRLEGELSPAQVFLGKEWGREVDKGCSGKGRTDAGDVGGSSGMARVSGR